MSVVTISPRFQIVTPREVRERFGLTPGQPPRVLEGDGNPECGNPECIPVRPIADYRGFLAGVETTLERDDDRV